MSEVQTDVAALITWAEEEARRDWEIAKELPYPPDISHARAEKLEAIATELRKLEACEAALASLLDSLSQLQCACSIKERLSGHLLGCEMPDLDTRRDEARAILRPRY